MTTISLDLPPELYRRAVKDAQVAARPVEQIVMEWIQPPAEQNQPDRQQLLTALEQMSNAELLHIARMKQADQTTERLKNLLEMQQQRVLTPAEYSEAEGLVQQEDLQTLRKAKALYLLKQRGALSPAFAR